MRRLDLGERDVISMSGQLYTRAGEPGPHAQILRTHQPADVSLALGAKRGQMGYGTQDCTFAVSRSGFGARGRSVCNPTGTRAPRVLAIAWHQRRSSFVHRRGVASASPHLDQSETRHIRLRVI